MKTRKQIPTVFVTAALMAQLALPAADMPVPRPDGKPADMTKKVKVLKTFVYAGYKDRPDSWEMDKTKGKATEPPPWLDKAGKVINWYAGKQYDDDTAGSTRSSKAMWPRSMPTHCLLAAAETAITTATLKLT
jgi:hypothetical protein